MRVIVVTPAGPGSRAGNRATALRWARHLRRLGHRVRVATDWQGESCDLLLALHARKSGRAALRFRAAHPDAPLVVALGGTDLYGDLARSSLARRACEAADRLVVLHREAPADLPAAWRSKARVILQSAERPPSARSARRRRPGEPRALRACVLAHLRPVKDPFLPARALRHLPSDVDACVLHAGRALDAPSARRARRETAANPAWRWLGELAPSRARSLLAS